MPAHPQDPASYAATLAALSPPGSAWPTDPDSVQAAVREGLAATAARFDAAAVRLLTDGFPSTALSLLPDWESSLGLPDPCTGPLPTVGQRRLQVVTRLANDGGQSVGYFTALAAGLGYSATITEFTPSRFGRGFGLPFGGEAWAHAFSVNVAGLPISHFQFGADKFGTPFSSWGSLPLECAIKRAAPGHCQPIFTYS